VMGEGASIWNTVFRSMKGPSRLLHAWCCSTPGLTGSSMTDTRRCPNAELRTHLRLADAAIAEAPPYPEGRYSGRGIVTCAGGDKYFPSAWVQINMLRYLGCTLPVELWHLGRQELTEDMAELVKPLGVTCVDAHQVRERYPSRILNGWEVKPYSIIHSGFEEVLFLDADNVPVVDPGFLFDTPQYREFGAVLWPDYRCLSPMALS